jgi:hypothetical protein
MLQVVPEPEFSAWYEALPEPLAEEVATAIDLAASFGGALGPERLSRLLLWFDGSGSSDWGIAGKLLQSTPERPLEHVRSYLMWHQEVLLCLESLPFRERLEQLEPEPAARALRLVERLKRKLHAARLSGSWSPWQGSPSRVIRAPLGSTNDVRGAFQDLLQLMGLDARAVLGSTSGLRELCIDNVRPQLRVLFGLDFPAKRLLAILGEPLDRRYYGDSVRRAEQRWQEYLGALGRAVQTTTP